MSAFTRHGMRIVVSPYHLSSREPPAMAALLLATDVLTMLPRPGRDRSDFVRAAAVVPGYLRFMESLEWSRPLWDEGVIRGDSEGHEVADDIRYVSAAIERDPQLLELRAIMRPGIFDDDERSLNALASDLLKGGPDPAVSVPVAAGLDRFAAMHDLFVARAAAVSVAQRAEAALATPLFAIAAPVLTQATGDRMLEARDTLERELSDLRQELAGAGSRALAELTPGSGDSRRSGADAARTRPSPAAPHSLRLAADAYAAAFEAARPDLTRAGDDPDDPRTIAGMTTLSFASLPVDAVITSSLAAVRSLSGARRSRAASSPQATGPRLPAERDPAAGLTITSIVVKLLGRSAR